MGVPAVKRGLPYRLEDIVKPVDVIGLAQARCMVLTGASMAGAELERLGLVTAVLPDQATMRAAAWAAPAAMADAPPDLARAAALAPACYNSADYAEGRAARQERRPPRFQGRSPAWPRPV